MRCGNCGTEQSAEQRFCVNCGTALIYRCAHCQAELPAGARFCPACGKELHKPRVSSAPAAVGHGQRPPASQRKQVSVLFADISGFTAMAEKLDAEELSDIVNKLWARLDPIITRHGGRVNQHVGDALMALFGAGAAREDEPQQAVRAALAMQASL